MESLVQKSQSVASELLHALRGKRSRPGFSRFLGYRSNIAQRWEAGESWPVAPQFFCICQRLQLDPRALVKRFLQRDPRWLATADLTTSAGVAAFLTEVRGGIPIRVLAERSGYNRYSVSRWLHGTTDPKLSEMLCVIEAASRRVLDFVATITDPAMLPSAAARWRELQKLREGAYSHPMSHAVLRALELDGYRSAGADRLGFLVARTGMNRAEVVASLRYLLESGQIRKTRHGFRPTQDGMVDTGADPSRARALRIAWVKQAVERLERSPSGRVGYSLFAVSRQDLERIRQLQLDFGRQMQGIIAGSKHCDCVALFCTQLVDMGE